MVTAANIPIVVDLDGTLTPTDTLVESLIQLVKQSPLNLLRLPIWLLRGRAGLKDAISTHTSISAELLPYRELLLEYLRKEKRNGRKIILATAAHMTIANRIAVHLGIFDEVLATDGNRNLKGQAKLEAIQESVGGDFVYAGDSWADIPVWKASKAAILVSVSTRLATVVKRDVIVEKELHGEDAGLSVWLRALRVHQWLKNLLLFVPMFTAFSFLDIGKVVTMMVAFLAFSFAASATYIVNDLWDLENDRAHPRKCLRPLASAQIPIMTALMMAAALLVSAMFLALAVSGNFFLMLLLYLALTSTYSWVLKTYVLLDVITLSLLYTLRILSGSVAIGVTTSSWLLAFSVFLFLSLALIKRCAELVALEKAGETATRGRDYNVHDLVVLWPLGVGAAISAVVVFGLFISAPETQARYATPPLMWLVAIGLVYWLSRLWIKTSRGEMHDDPVVYAIKDYGSRMTIMAMFVTILVAHYYSLESLL